MVLNGSEREREIRMNVSDWWTKSGGLLCFVYFFLSFLCFFV